MADPLQKRPWETRGFSVSVAPAMKKTDTIDSVTSVDVIGLDTMTISEIRHTTTVILFHVAGGESGESAQIRLRWQTGTADPGQMLEAAVPLVVTA